MIVIPIIISILYFSIIISFIIGFDKVETINNRLTVPKISFSIVVPFRNEAKNITDLLNSISALNYPIDMFEVLLINDASEDDSCTIIENFKQQFPSIAILLLNNKRISGSPKKDAINTAISTAKFDWIVTTDADCIVPKSWLHLFNQFIENKKPVFISAPVKFKEESSLLFQFQNLNFLSLIGSTIGSFGVKKPILCNGANLCYSKATFKKLNGFEGNSTIASGDDIFLLEKMIENFPEETHYLKSQDAIVETKSEKTIEFFLNQQIRWASKSTNYKNIFTKFVGIVIFTMNLTILILLISSLLFSFFWQWLILVFIAKILIDFILIQKTSEFLQNKIALKNYFPIAFLYPFFTIFIVTVSTFKSYKWKGRTFQK